MVWSPYGQQGFEAQKIWPFVIPYVHGRGLDVGCGPQVCLPHMIGVDNEKAPGKHLNCIHADAHRLPIIADESLDFVFSSHLLEHIALEKVPAVLREWWSKIRVGGHLILYLPAAGHYPDVGTDGANPDHKWNVTEGVLRDVLTEHLDAFAFREFQERTAHDEYSWFVVLEKGAGPEGHYRNDYWQRNPDGQKRALIIRLGAIGDNLVAASVAPWLKAENMHVTMLTTPIGKELLANNPWIDEVIVATKDEFPINAIIAFTEAMKERYDQIINLDRTIETLVVAREENPAFDYPAGARRLFAQHDYLEIAHAIADLPLGPERHPVASFWPTNEELRWVADGKKAVEGPIVAWAIAGSSFFKVYPWVNVVANWLGEQGINVVLIGDGEPTLVLERAILETMHSLSQDTTRMYPRVGKWSIRQSITFAMGADCLVGPETGLMHAVGLYDVPKVVYLSHSAEHNLSKYWKNATALAPEAERCPCFPCYQIHIERDTCNFDEEAGTARCMSSVAPVRVYDAIMRAIAQKKVDDEAARRG